MDRSEVGLNVLHQLRALGVRVVLDDFGTGYSSLAYLRQLPLDTIKVDRSFVTDLDVRDPNVGIVRAVVSLAHGLGITVVAEGIETDEQARRLRELGCDMGQGYAWAHPADPIKVGEFVARRLATGNADGSAAVAEDPEQEQEQVDEVEVEVERADARRPSRPSRRPPRGRPWRSAGRRTRSAP